MSTQVKTIIDCIKAIGCFYNLSDVCTDYSQFNQLSFKISHRRRWTSATIVWNIRLNLGMFWKGQAETVPTSHLRERGS